MKNNKNIDDLLVDDIVQDYKKRALDRRDLELQWRLNMNFFNGNQYAEISPRGDIEQYGKQYFWQEREVYNHIASIIETRLSKLARTNCGLTVRPLSNDDDDIFSAKLSTQIIKSVFEQKNISTLLNTATTWSEICGSCFFKVIWNSDMGRCIGIGENKKKIMEGDIDIAVIPPYELYPDNLNTANIEDCQSIIHAKAYSVEQIQDMYGVRVDGETMEIFDIGTANIGGGLGYSGSFSNSSSMVVEGYCTVIEKYCKPSTNYPNGRMIVVAGNKLLLNEELPYINDDNNTRNFPFVKIICTEKINSFFGTSIIERMIPLQRSYNIVKNRKHEYMNRLSMGILAVEDGSVDIDNLEEEGLSPGKVLVYRQGTQAPQLMDNGRIPSDFHVEEERLLSEFITISGVSELSKYSKTYGSMSGTAISLLVEQDDTRLAVASASIRMCIKKIGEQIVRLFKQFVSQKRLARITGDNGEIQVVYFGANNLQSEDIIFDNENDLSDSLASRRNMALELIKMGILTDEDGKISNRNKLKILDMMGFGNWDNARDIDECHRNKAIKENMDMVYKSIEVNKYDNHDIHIDEHIKYLISKEDISKKEMQKLESHIENHKLLKIVGDENIRSEDEQFANRE